jgi:predicted metal-dependent hydrolase
MPPRGTIADAKDFAQRHGGWIAARLGRLPKAAPFQAGVSVPLRGVAHRIVHRAGSRGTVWTETRDSGEKILCVAGGVEYVDRRIHDFLKREARRDLQKAADRYAAELGVKVKRLSIRDQSSRWGSCTSAGSLSFSWRLILAPPFVLDYLAAHEVAHLKEMNHSHRFWALTHKLCPRTEEAEAWLKRHGASLHGFG